MAADEADICLLEDTDKQCGHIFYNEASRLLKYYCTFCLATYEDINMFCMHLSDHIAEEQPQDAYSEDENSSEKDIGESGNNSMDNEEFTYDQESNATEGLLVEGDSGPLETLDTSDELEEIVDCEMPPMASYADGAEEESIELETSADAEFLRCSEEETPESNSRQVVNMPKQTFPRSRRPLDFEKLRAMKKKKRVTTVKVIAVKDRIAELYESIKREEEKRSQKQEQAKGDSEETAATEGTGEAQRNMIGETLVTRLPGELNSASETNASGNASSAGASSLLNTRSGEPERTCLACGKVFRSNFSLSIHRRSHYLESNSKIKLAHKCPDCDQLFNKIQELKEHVKKVHYPDGFECKICNRKLTRLSLLELHMRRVHLARPFSCSQCNRCFSDRAEYDVHVNSHREGNNFRCEICGRKYASEDVLEYHMKRHKKPIPQCCVVCGKMTLRITQHMKIHTPRPKRILSCSVCGKVFNFSSGLSHHFKIMHRMPRQAAKPKKDPPNASKPDKSQSEDKSDAFSEEHCYTQDLEAKDAKEVVMEAEATTGDKPKIDWTPLDVIAMDQKEEEAKRVIVELIQNSYAPCFLPDGQYDAAPPIAREETITAINSIAVEENLHIK